MKERILTIFERARLRWEGLTGRENKLERKVFRSRAKMRSKERNQAAERDSIFEVGFFFALLQRQLKPEHTPSMIHNAYNDDFGVNFQLPPPTSPLSSAFSQLSSSPPQLDPSTLALLGSFYEERSAAEQQFQELADRAAAQLSLDDEDKELEMISVDEFRALFGEDWQLSQFWYSPFPCCFPRVEPGVAKKVRCPGTRPLLRLAWPSSSGGSARRTREWPTCAARRAS